MSNAILKSIVVFLTLFMIMPTALAAGGQGQPERTAPIADFTYIADASNPLMITFTDASVGDETQWSKSWDFGDGSTSMASDKKKDSLTHTYAEAGTYTVMLTLIHDNSGGSSGFEDQVISKTITVTAPEEQDPEPENVPYADFSADKTSGDAPLVVSFTDECKFADECTEVWDFGDGTAKVYGAGNKVHTFQLPEGEDSKSFDVVLALLDAEGNSAGASLMQIEVFAPEEQDPEPENAPTAQFSVNKSFGYEPFTVLFSDECQFADALNHVWNFGDGTVIEDGAGNQAHTFMLPDGESYKMYFITLDLKDAEGDIVASSTTFIEVYAPEEQDPETGEYLPVADFTASPESGDMPLVVTFTNTSRNAESVEWFVEGYPVPVEQIVDNQFQWTFLNQGTYNVTLVARNGTESDSMTKLIEVNYVAPATEDLPIASFTATPESGNSPLTVILQNTSENTEYVYWYLDGVYLSDENFEPITLTFDEPGDYVIGLSARNGVNSDWTSKTIHVGEGSGIVYPPVASFEANVTSGYAPLFVKLTDTSTNATGIEWWIDGDLMSLNPVFEYEFTEFGNHTVKLYATNESYDGRSTAVQYIQVEQAEDNGEDDDGEDEGVLPIANFTANATEGDAPLAVQFVSTSENANETFWTIARDGDSEGVSTDEINPLFVFNLPGNYTVTLFVANDDGVDFKDMRISVTNGDDEPEIPQPPVKDAVHAAFDANVSIGYVPLTVEFTDMSVNATSVRWYVNGDKVSEDSVMIYTFDEAGNYKVELIATNGEVFDTASKMIVVTQQDEESDEEEDQTDDDNVNPGDNDDDESDDVEPGDNDDDQADDDSDEEEDQTDDDSDEEEDQADDDGNVMPGDDDDESDDDQADDNEPDNEGDDSSNGGDECDDQKDVCDEVKEDVCDKEKKDECAPVKDECKKKQPECKPVKVDKCVDEKKKACESVKKDEKEICDDQKEEDRAPVEDECEDQKSEREPVEKECVDDQKDVCEEVKEEECADQKEDELAPVEDECEEQDPEVETVIDDEDVDDGNEICDEAEEEESVDQKVDADMPESEKEEDIAPVEDEAEGNVSV